MTSSMVRVVPQEDLPDNSPSSVIANDRRTPEKMLESRSSKQPQDVYRRQKSESEESLEFKPDPDFLNKINAIMQKSDEIAEQERLGKVMAK